MVIETLQMFARVTGPKIDGCLFFPAKESRNEDYQTTVYLSSI